MEQLLRQHQIDTYITTTSDEHLSEYIGDSDQRVRYLTGFTGSNGIALTSKNNILYTDPRYYLQAKNELSNYELAEPDLVFFDCLTKSNSEIKKVGLNPKHFSYKWVRMLKDKLKTHKIELVLIEQDFVDRLWTDKPQRQFNEVYSIEHYKIHDYYKNNFKLLGYSGDHKDYMLQKDIPLDASIVGMTYHDKLAAIRKLIDVDETLLITELDTICWLFNLRGSDIEYNPVFYSYCTVTCGTAKIFCKAKIELEGVEVVDYDIFYDYIEKSKERFVISNVCNAYIDTTLKNHRYTKEIRQLQSIKSTEQLEGFNLAYILDGVALVKLFRFIENSNGEITEKQAADKLVELKSQYFGYKCPSFESIVGVGANSAIIHHSAGEVKIQNGIVLLDVGSNYVFGTTDTSRTLCVGAPDQYMKNIYSRVLKAQIRAMSQTYNKAVNGCVIDALTRLDLWNDEVDYSHACGHGVGQFTCVHENPPTLSMRYDEGIKPGQVFSIEPGFYIEDRFGVRLENLVYCKSISDKYIRLVNITYVPYQLQLIDYSMFTNTELTYLSSMFQTTKSMLCNFLQDPLDVDYLERNSM